MTERRICLLRHGETHSGATFRGNTDDELTDSGWRQMRAGVVGLANIRLVFSSPLKRCLHFAEDYAKRQDLPLEIVPDIQEMGFGEWEGQTAEQIMSADGQSLAAFWNDPASVTPPGGEPFVDFKSRVLDAWTRLVTHVKVDTLVVTHAGPIRVITLAERNLPASSLLRIPVLNGSLHCFEGP